MDHLAALLRTHPNKPADLNALLACLQATAECALVCTACADACLAEEMVSGLRECIRLDLDCAAICTATGAVLARPGAPVPVLRAQLAACIAACRDCGDLCGEHAAMQAHCAACSASCRECQARCAAMMAILA